LPEIWKSKMAKDAVQGFLEIHGLVKKIPALIIVSASCYVIG